MPVNQRAEFYENFAKYLKGPLALYLYGRFTVTALISLTVSVSVTV